MANHTNLNWSYSASANCLGPHQWASQFPVGKRQSPIDIQIDPSQLDQLTCAACGLPEQLQRELKLTKQQVAASGPLTGLIKRTQSDFYGGPDADYEHDNGDDDTEGRLCERSPSAASSSSSSHHTDSSGLSSGSSASSQAGKPREGAHGPMAPEAKHQDGNRQSTLDNVSALERPQVGDNRRQLADRQPMGANEPQNTRYCLTNKKLFLGYPRYLGAVNLCNTGHSWQINLPPELGQHTLLAGPPLGDREYRLAQLHCHWGEHNNCGSEHLMNGRSFAAEIHFVHWNCSQFESAEEASKHKHGLAVVAVLVQASADGGATSLKRNKHLDKIISGLPQINQPNSATTLQESRLDLKKLLPKNRWNYATYEGSLTTPPLNEVVDWIVFLQPIQCNLEQIEQFRQLKCSTGDKLITNCRPIQAQHGRIVSIWAHSHAH